MTIETIAQLQTFITTKNERLGLAAAALLNPAPSYPWPGDEPIRPTDAELAGAVGQAFRSEY